MRVNRGYSVHNALQIFDFAKIIMYNVLKLMTERNSKSTQYKRQYSWGPLTPTSLDFK